MSTGRTTTRSPPSCEETDVSRADGDRWNGLRREAVGHDEPAEAQLLAQDLLDDRRREGSQPIRVQSLVGRQQRHHGGDAASTARWKGSRKGSSAVVTSSTTPLLKSVFCATRPARKVLGGVTMPALCIPAMNATTWSATTSGSTPYSRSSSPIGAFSAAVPAGDDVRHRREVEIDAGRGELLAPLFRALAERRDRAGVALGHRDGIRANPGPRNAWICPPSWLAATKAAMSPSPSSSMRPGPRRRPRGPRPPRPSSSG